MGLGGTRYLYIPLQLGDGDGSQIDWSAIVTAEAGPLSFLMAEADNPEGRSDLTPLSNRASLQVQYCQLFVYACHGAHSSDMSALFENSR